MLTVDQMRAMAKEYQDTPLEGVHRDLRRIQLMLELFNADHVTMAIQCVRFHSYLEPSDLQDAFLSGLECCLANPDLVVLLE